MLSDADFGAFVRALSPGEFLDGAPHLSGGDRDAMSFLFALHLGLLDEHSQADATDVTTTGRILRQRLAGTDPDVATVYVLMFAASLHLPPPETGALAIDSYGGVVRDSVAAGLTVLEGYAGIQPDDYPDKQSFTSVPISVSDVLGTKLRACLKDASPGLATQFLGQFAASCSHNPHRGAHCALAAIESFFDLAGGLYIPQVFESRLAHYRANAGFGFILLLSAWAPHLCGLGRTGEAQSLLTWVFGWNDSDLKDGQRLAARVRAQVQGLPPDLASPIFGVVPTVMHTAVSRTVVRQFVEHWLGIEDYRDPELVLAKITHNEQQELLPEVRLGRLFALLQALAHTHAHDNALAVLTALVRQPAESPLARDELVGRWSDFGARLPGHHRAQFHMRVAHTLFALDRRADAIHYLEKLFDLTPAHYTGDPATMASRLRYMTAAFSPEEPVLLACQLAAALSDESGREQDTLAFLEAYLWWALELDTLPLVNAAAVVPVCTLLELWLDRADPRVAYSRCGQILAFLRRCLGIRGFHLEDREQFVRDIATLRRRVLQIGYDRAGADGSLNKEVLCWDVELGQRLLFERYRFHKPGTLSPTTPSSLPPSSKWSLREDPPDGTDYLPTNAVETHVGRFGLARGGVTAVSAGAPDLADSPDDRCRAAEQILREGITIGQLAEALGATTLLVRAGFTTDGRLFWRAFQSDGMDLHHVAGETGADIRAATDVATAVAWHDGLLEAIWAEQQLSNSPLRALCRHLHALAEEIRARLARRGGSVDTGALTSTLNLLHERCTSDEATARGFAEWLQSLAPGDWSSVTDRRPWVGIWADAVRTLDRLARGTLEEQLDSATAEFLRWVTRLWDLRPLVPHLNADTDVVVEVEDGLHAVPVAFLPLSAGEGVSGRLFEQVRSVRSSLSLLLRLLHKSEPSLVDVNGLVTVSWFAPDDSARRGAWWLHHGQRVLAQRHRCNWVSAADNPQGDSTALADALGAGAKVLAVCGHGWSGGPGVNLADGTWAGERADLGRVNWLLSVSCSIGRVAQKPGVPDLDGFTAALLARRVRAALACRWPVHALQAAWFANEVTQQYLSDCAATCPVERASALARARRRFLGSGAGSPGLVGLNTLAAFDLYGEG